MHIHTCTYAYIFACWKVTYQLAKVIHSHILAGVHVICWIVTSPLDKIIGSMNNQSNTFEYMSVVVVVFFSFSNIGKQFCSWALCCYFRCCSIWPISTMLTKCMLKLWTHTRSLSKTRCSAMQVYKLNTIFRLKSHHSFEL